MLLTELEKGTQWQCHLHLWLNPCSSPWHWHHFCSGGKSGVMWCWAVPSLTLCSQEWCNVWTVLSFTLCRLVLITWHNSIINKLFILLKNNNLFLYPTVTAATIFADFKASKATIYISDLSFVQLHKFRMETFRHESADNSFRETNGKSLEYAMYRNTISNWKRKNYYKIQINFWFGY